MARMKFSVAAALALAFTATIAHGQPSAWTQHEHYEGFIDGKIAVIMELTTDDAFKIKGTYQYAISGKDLYLAGTSSTSDPFAGTPVATTVVLTETADSDKPTGTFRLQRADDTGNLAGTWTSADSNRVLDVGLAKIADTHYLVAQKPNDYSVHTGYLEFPQRNDFLKTLNARLKAESQPGQAALLKDALADSKDRAKSGAHYEWEAIVEPSVTFADASFVSIKTLHYAYTGGAHGMTTYSAANFTWRDGALAELALGDILDTKSTTLGSVAKILIRNLKAQKASSPDDLILDKTHPPTLNVTRAGLLFTFDPYAVGVYAEGAYTVLIPWKEAADFIPAASPVQRLMGAAPLPAPPRQITPTPPAPSSGGDFPRPG